MIFLESKQNEIDSLQNNQPCKKWMKKFWHCVSIRFQETENLNKTINNLRCLEDSWPIVPISVGKAEHKNLCVYYLKKLKKGSVTN